METMNAPHLRTSVVGNEARASLIGAAAVPKGLTSQDSKADHSLSPKPHEIYKRSLPSLHFLRWRPMYHVQAPNGWMNDPCGPGYDPTTGLYHLFYQWNPKRNTSGQVVWGTIWWGHATSEDLVNWTVSPDSALQPDGSWFDQKSCFTGCLYPKGLGGEPGELTIFYTGVSSLPLHYTIPYKRPTETLVIAQSKDGGFTWDKHPDNPIKAGPPAQLDITGWRDPFVAPWPSVDKLLGLPEGEQLYGMISGGLRHKTPTAFLYSINPQDIRQWHFLNTMMDVGINFNISRWTADLGVNWECVNFVTLTSDVDGSSREFFILGGEGSDMHHPNSSFHQHPPHLKKFPRCERSLPWICGTLSTEEGPDGTIVPKMDYAFSGRFDHSLLYAVNSFYDPVSKKQIAWGWVTEEDLPQKAVDRQSWSGMMSIPRELSLVVIKDVVKSLKTELKDISSIEAVQETEGYYTVRTLGISPSEHLQKLRKGTNEVAAQGPQVLTTPGETFMDVRTHRFELSCVFDLSDECDKAGFTIFHTEDYDKEHGTTVYLDAEIETFAIERPMSKHVDSDIIVIPEAAPFTLFSTKTPDGTKREVLEVRAFFDESVLEVFVNQRTCFTTRVYPSSKCCYGIRFWAEDESKQTTLIEAKAWDGLRATMNIG